MTALLRLAEQMRTARSVTVLTGAGVSAASGVPTFRGAGALWQNFNAADLATPLAFARAPHTVWNWYAWRREQIGTCEPNAAHAVLAAWTRRRQNWRVVTQNVDDLHMRAGTRELVRLHGSIFELRCWASCARSPQSWRDDRVPLPEMPPRCPHCGGLARPGVVWFGEALHPSDLEAAEALTQCDVFIAAGTSALVHPAAGLLDQARSHGAFIAELNIESTEATAAVHAAVRGPVERTLAELDALL